MISKTAGGRSLEGQMVKLSMPEITIYLRMHLHAPFQRCDINSLCTRSVLVLYERVYIAGTKLVWTGGYSQ